MCELSIVCFTCRAAVRSFHLGAVGGRKHYDRSEGQGTWLFPVQWCAGEEMGVSCNEVGVGNPVFNVLVPAKFRGSVLQVSQDQSGHREDIGQHSTLLFSLG